MKVQEVLLSENNIRYILLDDSGLPILPVTRYLKYLDLIGKSRNTQKTYCYSLKLYFAFLSDIQINYNEIHLYDLAKFIGWLRNPYQHNNVVSITKTKAKRKESTINLSITVVINFYDFLYRNSELSNDLIEKVMRKIYTNGRTSYKNFLYHITKADPSFINILKLKEPKVKMKVLTKEEVKKIKSATNNLRDRFLIQLLFETGFRISEALSLHLEDFKYDHANGHKIQLINRGPLPNGANLKTGEREVFVSQELMDLFDDYMYEILDNLEIDTDFVFIKIAGPNKGAPLEYQNVSSLFKRLKKITHLNVHPHLLRHTHATLYYRQTKNIKQVQERLGHSQIQTTMNMYLHLTEEDIRENWEIAQPSFNFEKERDNEK